MFHFPLALPPHWFHYVCFGLKPASLHSYEAWWMGQQSYLYKLAPRKNEYFRAVSLEERKDNQKCLCHSAWEKNNYSVNVYLHIFTQAFPLMHNCSVKSSPMSPQDHLLRRKISSCTWKWSESQTLTNGKWLSLAIPEDLSSHQIQAGLEIESWTTCIHFQEILT